MSFVPSMPMPLNTILVEDSETIRSTLIPAMAELADLHVVAFAEGADDAIALLAAHAEGWEVAVVDIFLKQGSGLAVLRGCQVRRPYQRVVVLTNYLTPDIRKRCAELGADAVFDKSNELDAFFDLCSSFGGKP